VVEVTPALRSVYVLWYMYYIWYEVAEKGPAPQKIPLLFFRTEAGSEPVRDWLKGLAEGIAGIRAPRRRERPIKSAMAVAGGYAAVPSVRWRIVGGTDELGDEADYAGVAQSLPRPPDSLARICQEDADHAG
jgi:hypothetical protein